MSNRRNTTAAVALLLVTGLGMQPLAAQENDRVAALIAAYPMLAAIEDKDCLARLADYEAERSKGALIPLIEGKASAKEFARADGATDPGKDFSKCLEAVEKQAKTGLDGASGKAPSSADGTADEKATEDAKAENAKSDDAHSENTLDRSDRHADGGKRKNADRGAHKDADKQKAPDEKAALDEKAASDRTPATASSEKPAGDTTSEKKAAFDEKAANDEKSGVGSNDTVATVGETAPDEKAATGTAERATSGSDGTSAPTTEEETAKPEQEAVAKETAERDTEKRGKAKGRHKIGSNDQVDEAAKSDGDKTEGAKTEDPKAADAVQKDTEAAAKAADAVQKDTEAAAKAANAAVKVEATAKAEGDAVKVETETVTVDTARISSEDFKTYDKRRKDLDKGPSFGAAAVGALGGIVLNELLGPNEEVVENTGDRVVIRRGRGDYYVLKDESALLRRPGTEVETRRFDDGSVRETVTRRNGVKVVTIRAANGQVVRRVRMLPDGRSFVLFDDTARFDPVDLDDLKAHGSENVEIFDDMDADTLRRRLVETEKRAADRRYSLRQIRNIRAVRTLVTTLQLESINFETGSAAIRPSEAEELAKVGRAMVALIDQNPYEVFLIEGHTDAVGSAAFNLVLSDRRAESVALALTEYFDVPPENMVVQGYGESNMRVPTDGPERRNRRAAVRRITPLLGSASMN